MNLIEHLEHVLGLVERSASQAEVKGALLGMQEEIHGTQAAADKYLALAEKDPDFEKRLNDPQFGQRPLTLSGRTQEVLKFVIGLQGDFSPEQIAQHFHISKNEALRETEALAQIGFAIQTTAGVASYSGTSRGRWGLTPKGRTYGKQDLA